MATSNNNSSVLPWYSSLAYQNHNKPYAYDVVWPLVSVMYKLPPFQVHRTTNLTGAITSFELHQIETGNNIDVLAALNLVGLTVESFTGYDLITYPGIDAMSDIVLTEGQYYGIMSDGTTTWYSDIFYMRQSVTKYIKLSFWHDEPFMFADHHISYADPFQNFVYLDSVINKPRYPSEFEEDDRGGYSFLIFGVTDKHYRFPVLVPEYLADVLRLVPLHHYVTVEFDGITYEVDKIVFNATDWLEQGHLIPVEFVFQTRHTNVQMTGKVKPENAGYSYDQQAYDDSHL